MMIPKPAYRLIPVMCLLLAGNPLLIADTTSPGERIRELRDTIAHHDRLYFEEARPEISDAAYDRLVAELEALERGHAVPMLSLKKVHGPDGIRSFVERLVAESGLPAPEICLEPKIDGMAVSLVYVDGRLDRALTRGNGQMGVDISHSVREIEGIPAVLKCGQEETPPRYLELRGECFIPIPHFERLNAARMAAGESPFSTERNLAAGTVMSENAGLVRERGLRFACFDWGAWEPRETSPDSQVDFLETARAWGIPVVESFGTASGVDAVLQMVRAARKAARESTLPLDGLVLKVNDVRLRGRLGSAPEAPNWAVAYKFPPEEVVTELLAIHYQIGRTGRLSPVAELRPVVIDGREISRASLHNWAFIREHDLRLGDRLVIALSGDVIPRISGLKAAASLPGSRPVEFPRQCPECGGVVTWTESMAAGMCGSANCPGRLREEILHFGNVMGIRGLGPASARLLVEGGWITMPADLFRLASNQERLAGVLGEANGQALVAEIEAARGAPIGQVVEALGMPGIGKAGAARIADRFASWDALINWSRGNGPAASAELDPRLAQQLGDYLQDPARLRNVELLASVLNSSAEADGTPDPSREADLPAGPE
jgi:DNA ligase (NAD+)